jgi:hypothetical protein
MNYSIEIDHDKKIFKYKHSGLITKDDIGQAWQEMLQTKEFTILKYNMLTDYSDAEYDMILTDVDEITTFLKGLKEILHKKKQALVVNDPVTTAFSLLFENQVVTEVGFNVKVFNSVESALVWLEK